MENDFKTLEEAKQHLRDNYQKGTICPCCKQTVKLYKRKLSALMVCQLIELYKMPYGWHHVNEISKRKYVGGGEFAKLRYWGFIEKKANTDRKKAHSGVWRITERGQKFITGELANVAKYCHTYNAQLMGYSEERTTITQALGNGFDFDELMNS